MVYYIRHWSGMLNTEVKKRKKEKVGVRFEMVVGLTD